MARILLIGATGFIGSEIARTLICDYPNMRLAARDLDYGRRLFPQANWVRVDLNRQSDAASWGALVDGCSLVINASGLLQNSPGDDVTRVQYNAIVGLAEACAAAGVQRIVHISAAGIEGNDSDFMVSKADADATLLSGTVPVVVLRPGLVIGRNAYGGSELIRMAASLPVGLIPGFAAPIRCIAMADVMAALRRALADSQVPPHPIDLVGEEAHDLADIIRAHRRWLALPDWRWSWTMPPILIRAASIPADGLGLLGWRSPLRSNAITALRCGVDGDHRATREWLDRSPMTLDAMLAALPAGKQDRAMAATSVLMPVGLLALVAMWSLSGVATLIDLPGATAILTAAGFTPETGQLLAIAGAVADLLLAALLLLRRTVRPALLGVIALSAIYLLMASLSLPSLWLDPLAPLAKVLPTMVLAAMLLLLTARR